MARTRTEQGRREEKETLTPLITVPMTGNANPRSGPGAARDCLQKAGMSPIKGRSEDKHTGQLFKASAVRSAAPGRTTMRAFRESKQGREPVTGRRMFQDMAGHALLAVRASNGKP